MKLNIAAHRKTIIATVGGVLSWAQVSYVPDGHIDRGELYGLAVTLATAAGVYGVANRQTLPSVWVDAPVADAYPDGEGPPTEPADAAPAI